MELDDLKGLKTLTECVSEFDGHSNLIRNWKNDFLDNASALFGELLKNSRQKKQGALVAERGNVRRLIQIMAVMVMYPKKSLSVVKPASNRYPYLLLGDIPRKQSA